MSDHYKKGAIPVEPIVVCSRMSFCLGNFVKYMCRAPYKGTELEDYKKALWYINYMDDRTFNDEVDRLQNDRILCEILAGADPVVKYLLLKRCEYDIRRMIQESLNDSIKLRSLIEKHEPSN